MPSSTGCARPHKRLAPLLYGVQKKLPHSHDWRQLCTHADSRREMSATPALPGCLSTPGCLPPAHLARQGSPAVEGPRKEGVYRRTPHPTTVSSEDACARAARRSPQRAARREFLWPRPPLLRRSDRGGCHRQCDQGQPSDPYDGSATAQPLSLLMDDAAERITRCVASWALVRTGSGSWRCRRLGSRSSEILPCWHCPEKRGGARRHDRDGCKRPSVSGQARIAVGGTGPNDHSRQLASRLLT